MNKSMQLIYDHILERSLIHYYRETDYYSRCAERNAAGRKLWEQLSPDQRLLLEEVQNSYDRTADCELEAMFLAVFDECLSLFQFHTSL